MNNSAAALQFLKAEWEAQRIAFEVAQSVGPLSALTPQTNSNQTSFDLSFRPEDSAVPKHDPRPRRPSRAR